MTSVPRGKGDGINEADDPSSSGLGSQRADGSVQWHDRVKNEGQDSWK